MPGEPARETYGESRGGGWNNSIPWKFFRTYKVPPGNRLEALTRDRRGQHSIRINDQYRVCFVWTTDGPDRVEIVDYH